jgi:hypothetical protein
MPTFKINGIRFIVLFLLDAAREIHFRCEIISVQGRKVR